MAYARLAGVLALLLVFPGTTAADTVHLTNGDVVTGKILELDGDKIVFDGDLIDEVRIGIEDIASIETSRPFSIQYDDGSAATGYIVMENGQMVLRSERPEKEQRTDPVAPERPEASDAAATVTAMAAGDDVEVAVGDADDVAVNEVPTVVVDREHVETAAAVTTVASDGRVVTLADIFTLEAVETYFRYEAEIDVGINVSKGNTDQSSFNLSGMVAPSFGKNTVRLGGQLNRAEADGATTASNWRIDASYEREFTRRWRAIALNRYENDKFQDLDLRATVAAGPGYSILLENPSLDVSLAPAYVHQAFTGEASRDFAALFWRLNFEYEIPKPDVTFYHNHSLTVGVTERQTVALTTTGFKWELIGDLDLKLEYQLNWNSNPADDAQEFDQRYLLKISYDFDGDENDWFH